MYHKLTIVGNLGGEPELRYLPNGTPLCNFSVAANRRYTNADGELVTETVWFRVTVWGKQAEACARYLHKGSLVMIDGRLTPDLQTGGPRIFQRRDGTPGASYEVRAEVVRFLSRSDSDEEEEPGNAAKKTAAPAHSDLPGEDEEIPF